VKFRGSAVSQSPLGKRRRMKFSVIIAVRSINDFLKENIINLKKLDYEDFEVLLVLDEQERYDFADPRFHIISIGKKGPGEKRNIGAQHAKGDIYVFLDDDAYPSRNWLVKAEEVFADKTVYALGAPAVTPPNAVFLERCSGRVLESWLSSAEAVYRYIPKRRMYIDDYPTVNLFVRKDAFWAVGGFTKEFWPGEDTKLCLDLSDRFGKFLYDPSPIVYHHRRILFKPHLKQISRYGTHRGQFARIYPKTSRRPSYFVPALFVAGLLLGPALAGVLAIFWVVYFAVLVVYLALIVLEAAKVAIKDRNMPEAFYVGAGIILSHLVYGSYFVYGFFRRPVLKLKKIDTGTGNYIEG